jgi:hypothetical protein
VLMRVMSAFRIEQTKMFRSTTVIAVAKVLDPPTCCRLPNQAMCFGRTWVLSSASWCATRPLLRLHRSSCWPFVSASSWASRSYRYLPNSFKDQNPQEAIRRAQRNHRSTHQRTRYRSLHPRRAHQPDPWYRGPQVRPFRTR